MSQPSDVSPKEAANSSAESSKVSTENEDMSTAPHTVEAECSKDSSLDAHQTASVTNNDLDKRPSEVTATATTPTTPKRPETNISVAVSQTPEIASVANALPKIDLSEQNGKPSGVLYEVRYYSIDDNEQPHARKLPRPLEEIETPSQGETEPLVMKVVYCRKTELETVAKLTTEDGETQDKATDDAKAVEVQAPKAEDNSESKPVESKAEKPVKLLPFKKRLLTYIEIQSPAVREAIRSSLDYYPDLDLDVQTLALTWPYPPLAHCDDMLREYQTDFEKRKCESASCFGRYAHRHLGIVRDFFREALGDTIQRERQRYERGVATFDMLWYLYRPGDDVLYDGDELDEYEPYVVRSLEWTYSNESIIAYTLTLWNMDSNSWSMNPTNTVILLNKFSGEKEITSLRVYPFKFLKKNKDGKSPAEVRSHFKERGETFFKLQRQGCWDYRGLSTTFPRRPFEGMVVVDPDQYVVDNLAQRVIVDDDFDTADKGKATGHGCCQDCQELLQSRQKKFRFAGYAKINPLKAKELTPHQYFLCGRNVEAFVIKHRAWKTLHVSGFKPVPSNTKMLDTLVLEQPVKKMIEGLTKKYLKGLQSEAGQKEDSKDFGKSSEEKQTESDSWSADFIKGKGEGLIFLLHGKPGVGKTYTAECIAADAERPLLTLTSADIGTSPEMIESKLMRWFKLATNWKAIMLIDEADIYMEHRKVQDLERNNLVAGFLRSMEYYKGILFLTTNRVGTFDEAFISRINLTIYYKPFSAKEREDVWESFFRKLEREREDKMRILQSTRDYIAEAKEVTDLKWNGREIRNAFQTAVALAEVENDVVKGRILIKKDHIRATVEMSRAFKKYMERVHKKDEDALATYRGIRHDSTTFEKSTPPQTPLR